MHITMARRDCATVAVFRSILCHPHSLVSVPALVDRLTRLRKVHPLKVAWCLALVFHNAHMPGATELFRYLLSVAPPGNLMFEELSPHSLSTFARLIGSLTTGTSLLHHLCRVRSNARRYAMLGGYLQHTGVEAHYWNAAGETAFNVAPSHDVQRLLLGSVRASLTGPLFWTPRLHRCMGRNIHQGVFLRLLCFSRVRTADGRRLPSDVIDLLLRATIVRYRRPLLK